MEIGFNNTSQIKKHLRKLKPAAVNRSWVLRRFEGTGRNFWRITWSDLPEWEGQHHDVDGLTVAEVVRNTISQMESR